MIVPMATTPVSSDNLQLPTPPSGRRAAERYVAKHLGSVAERRGRSASTASSLLYRGGQQAANAALARFDVGTYRQGRQLVYPQSRRTWSMLSPWIRHGMLSLRQVWDWVEGGADDQVSDFRRVLLRQEHARHIYGAYSRTPKIQPGLVAASSSTRSKANPVFVANANVEGVLTGNLANPSAPEPIDETEMGCLELLVGELMDDGWLPDDGRKWLADYWVARRGLPADSGRRWFASHLLDGSGASNLINWRMAAEEAAVADTGMSRWEIEAQAPGLCATCTRVFDCPIDQYRAPLAVKTAGGKPASESQLAAPSADPEWVAGPRTATFGANGPDHSPQAVWITAESMGDADPALMAHPDLPAVFVFDKALLEKIRLSSKRLVFLTETLADLATRREVEVWFGDPVKTLAGRPVAVTHTPTPGWRRRSAQIEIAVTHPWPWLVRPDDVKMASSLLGSDSDVRKESLSV